MNISFLGVTHQPPTDGLVPGRGPECSICPCSLWEGDAFLGMGVGRGAEAGLQRSPPSSLPLAPSLRSLSLASG